MPQNPADTRQELTAEIARLDRELEADARWCELASIEAAGPLKATALRRIELECDLLDNPVFLQRQRIAEALAALPSETQASGRSAADAAAAVAEVKSDAQWIEATPDVPRPVTPAKRESIASRIAPLLPAAAAGEPRADDLTRIKGISPEIAGWLAAAGVRRFADIASWTAADVARFRVELGVGRDISRANWIEQAALLAGKEQVPAPRPAGKIVEAAPAAAPEPVSPAATAATLDAGPVAASASAAEPASPALTAAVEPVTAVEPGNAMVESVIGTEATSVDAGAAEVAATDAATDAATGAVVAGDPLPPPPALDVSAAKELDDASANAIIVTAVESGLCVAETAASMAGSDVEPAPSIEAQDAAAEPMPAMAAAPAVEWPVTEQIVSEAPPSAASAAATPAAETLEERLDRLDELAATPAPAATGPQPRAFIRDNGLSRIMARRRENQLWRESIEEADGKPYQAGLPPQAGVSFVRPGPAAHATPPPPAAPRAPINVPSPAVAATSPPLRRTPPPPVVTVHADTPHRFRRPLTIAPARSGEAEFREWAPEASVEIVRKDDPKRHRPGLAQSLAATPAIGRFIRALKGEE